MLKYDCNILIWLLKSVVSQADDGNDDEII